MPHQLGAAPVKFSSSARSVDKRWLSWRRSVAVVSLITMTAISFPTVMKRPAKAAFPGRNGRIAFTVSQVKQASLNFDLFTISASGHDLQKLTGGPEEDSDPAWSRDGQRLAFARLDFTASAADDIYTLDVSGGEVTNLTSSPLDNDTSPSWAPDGKRIAFTRELNNPFYFPRGLNSDIYIMGDDGTNVVQLTHDSGRQSDPAWSPFGDAIAYVDRGSSIRLIGSDGLDDRLVAGELQTASDPSWSPDGERIAFVSGNDIWTVRRDGSSLSRVSIGLQPSWSPDGNWIAFLSRRGGDYKLCKMRSDGSRITEIVGISLSPDSTGIDWGPRP